MEKELDDKKELKEKEELLIECADGKKRTCKEYREWLDELVMKYN